MVVVRSETSPTVGYWVALGPSLMRNVRFDQSSRSERLFLLMSPGKAVVVRKCNLFGFLASGVSEAGVFLETGHKSRWWMSGSLLFFLCFPLFNCFRRIPACRVVRCYCSPDASFRFE